MFLEKHFTELVVIGDLAPLCDSEVDIILYAYTGNLLLTKMCHTYLQALF